VVEALVTICVQRSPAVHIETAEVGGQVFRQAPSRQLWETQSPLRWQGPPAGVVGDETGTPHTLQLPYERQASPAGQAGEPPTPHSPQARQLPSVGSSAAATQVKPVPQAPVCPALAAVRQ